MIDFLFSCDRNRESVFSISLTCFRPDQPTRTFSGEWGTLVTVGRPYPAFDTVETDRHITVVLGGPLPRHDDTIASGDESHDGTRWIFQHWKQKRTIRWDEDLVGHFLVLCIDKETGTAEVVTDINAFVPVYRTEDTPLVIGSHADAVAMAAGSAHDIDPVSVADFLTYSTVTYPYTMYKPVKHLPPATVTRFGSDSEPSSSTYWEPREKVGFKNIREAAKHLRAVITANVRRICAGQEKIGLLISGGEDSRIVASLVPKPTRAHAITITDSYNREAQIAERVCRTLGVEWDSVTRSPTHYLDYATKSISLSESNNCFLHGHINGFEHNLPAGCRVIGGVMADAFCKGSHIKGKMRAGLKYKLLLKDWHYGGGDFPLNSALARSVNNRRRIYNSRLKHVRPRSWAEWHSLTPACMNTNLAFLFINRRLFPSCEPFADALLVKTSAAIPHKWKINRQLFYRAMRPVLRQTRWIPHGNGLFPYFNVWSNIPVRVIRRFQRKFWKKKAPNSTHNDGPWPNWEEVVSQHRFYELYPRDDHTWAGGLPPETQAPLRDLVQSCKANDSARTKLCLLQVKLWLKGLLREGYDYR